VLLQSVDLDRRIPDYLVLVWWVPLMKYLRCDLESSSRYHSMEFYGDAHMFCVVLQHTPAVFGACCEDWTNVDCNVVPCHHRAYRAVVIIYRWNVVIPIIWALYSYCTSLSRVAHCLHHRTITTDLYGPLKSLVYVMLWTCTGVKSCRYGAHVLLQDKKYTKTIAHNL